MNTSLHEKFKICEERLNSANYNNQKYITKKTILLKLFNKSNDKQFEDYIEISTFSSENYFEAIDNLTTSTPSPSFVDELFKYTLRFVKEKILRTGEVNEKDIEIISYYNKNYANLDNKEKEDQIFVDTCFTEFFINDGLNINSPGSHFGKFKEEFTELERKIELYKNALTDLHSEYNFVSLSHAFSKLLDIKHKEIKKLSIYSMTLAVSALLIPSITLAINPYQSINSISTNPLNTQTSALILPYLSISLPILIAELLIVYYFRIILQQFYSTKGQILQLNHRQAACAFIEGYAHFIKDKPGNLFKKFEELIFSPVSFSPDKIPSTLDGIDQLSTFVKACTKK